MSTATRICIVGAGAIAETHAAAIDALPGLEIGAVVDPDARARERFSDRWSAPAYPSVAAALATGGFEAAHILTPPDGHAAAAEPFLGAGLPTLVEKPLAATSQECARLLGAAARSGAVLGVNQNFVFDPAFQRLRDRLAAGEIGPLRHIACVYHAPLRQLAARQLGHWMFRAPANILLEQAVHPLSQIRALAGHLGGFAVLPDRIETAGFDQPFLQSLTASIEAERASASFRFSVGEAFPVWRIEAFGTDGALVADIYQGRCYGVRRTRWLDAIDQPLSAARTAAEIFGAGIANTARYSLSQVRLAPRADPFFRSMRASISAFHEAVRDRKTPETDGVFGAELVGLCDKLAEAAAPARAAAPKTRSAPTSFDVAVIGGTGFIGTHAVEALLAAGYSVGVMARNTANLDPVFAHPKVSVIGGDMRRREDVERAIGGARLVVNLAHGGGGATYDAILAAMRGGAEVVAQVTLQKGAERFVHVGSIASLYLGSGVVGDADGPDPRAAKRAPYARAKAETDNHLQEMRGLQNLPLILLRPGLVVGAGTSPLHSGLGFFNNEQHCIGWNAGTNPLPFVLAGDVGAAIVGALTAPNATGNSYLVVGDVRPSARDYIAELGRRTGRPLRFHPSSPEGLWAGEAFKWAIKQVGGRRASLPSLRDIRSRGLAATIDATAAKRDLGWTPEADLERFYDAAFAAKRNA